MDPVALERQLDDAFSGISVEELNESLNASICDVKVGEIVIAKVDTVDERTGLVIMDVGGKAEAKCSHQGGSTRERSAPPACPTA